MCGDSTVNLVILLHAVPSKWGRLVPHILGVIFVFVSAHFAWFFQLAMWPAITKTHPERHIAISRILWTNKWFNVPFAQWDLEKPRWRKHGYHEAESSLRSSHHWVLRYHFGRFLFPVQPQAKQLPLMPGTISQDKNLFHLAWGFIKNFIFTIFPIRRKDRRIRMSEPDTFVPRTCWFRNPLDCGWLYLN